MAVRKRSGVDAQAGPIGGILMRGIADGAGRLGDELVLHQLRLAAERISDKAQQPAVPSQFGERRRYVDDRIEPVAAGGRIGDRAALVEQGLVAAKPLRFRAKLGQFVRVHKARGSSPAIRLPIGSGRGFDPRSDIHCSRLPRLDHSTTVPTGRMPQAR